jgi:hypothetical protein
VSSGEKGVGTPHVFVAYSYRLYSGPEYREVYRRLEGSCGVKFEFADSRITNTHILDKITTMIQDADFSLFDISDWNPNVTLELGIAKGGDHPWYILIDPSKSTGGIFEAPADLRGLDRVQYSTLEELETGVERLVRGRRPVKQPRVGAESAAEDSVFDDTITVDAGSHTAIHVDLAAGSSLTVLAQERQRSPFNIYVMDRKNYVRYGRRDVWHDIVAKEDEYVYDFRKRVPRAGTWYVVLDAFRKSADREVELEVRSRPPSP